MVTFPCHRGSNNSVHLLASGKRNLHKYINWPNVKPVENCYFNYLSAFFIVSVPTDLVLGMLGCAESSSFCVCLSIQWLCSRANCSLSAIFQHSILYTRAALHSLPHNPKRCTWFSVYVHMYWMLHFGTCTCNDLLYILTRFNKISISNNKFQMASGQGSHWLIESPTIFSSMCSPPLSDICQFYF